MMIDSQILERGLTHPQIHLDYYEWLDSIRNDKVTQEFIKQHCPRFDDFHAIAMFVWSASRETLTVKTKA